MNAQGQKSAAAGGDRGFAGAQDAGRVDVCLVSMPYAALQRPNIALGLLKRILADGGLRASVAYANLWFAEIVGIRPYHLCANQAPTELLIGEWTFAGAAFGDLQRADDEEYLRRVAAARGRIQGYKSGAEGRDLVAELRRLRAVADEFVETAARRVLASGARIVGCTSTFEQHVASLALLRRIRELDPTVRTVIGGANCETAMGAATHRHFPWVDYVVSGEADGLIVDLFHDLMARGGDIPPGELPAGVLGPRHRANGNGNGNGLSRSVFRDLAALPVPDFSDYFNSLHVSPLGRTIEPGLPLETSRGCWWGDVRHCKFCGLNGTAMSFRSKPAEQVLAEIHELERRHGISGFEAVDNILDMSYLRTVLPRLAEEAKPRRLFYEVKANLKREQIRQMRAAGITWIQPGIESLHSGVLELIDKGVQGWQNIQLLRWAREVGLRMSWAILWSFPGEEDEWYVRMAEWIPLLEHLQAPSGLIRLRYDRFSVYYERAVAMGLDLAPISAMRYVYPLPGEALHDLAYFFTDATRPDAFGNGSGQLDLPRRRPGVLAVLRAVKTWRARFYTGLKPVLAMTDRGDRLEILDTRACASATRFSLDGLARALLLACDEAPPVARLPQLLARRLDGPPHPDELAAAIDDLRQRGLLLAVDRRLINLAVAGDLPEIPDRQNFPGGFVEAEDATFCSSFWTAQQGRTDDD